VEGIVDIAAVIAAAEVWNVVVLYAKTAYKVEDSMAK
jgi:hypothetical protein